MDGRRKFQELVELIIFYFVHDTFALPARSMTCYSLYITDVPHPHHTLMTDVDFFSWHGGNLV